MLRRDKGRDQISLETGDERKGLLPWFLHPSKEMASVKPISL